MEEAMLTVGDILRQKREEKGLSIKTVVDYTYIQAKFIIALECNDYSIFPAEVYTRGFLRNYSEMLGLDASEILELFKQTKDTVTPSYDHKYDKNSIALEPEVQKVENIEARKANIEKARAAANDFNDDIKPTRVVHNVIKEQEILEESGELANILGSNVGQNEEKSAGFADESVEQLIVVQSDKCENASEDEQLPQEKQIQQIANTAANLEQETPKKKHYYSQPPSFRQKLEENRGSNGSVVKKLVFVVLIILAIGAAYIFIVGKNNIIVEGPSNTPMNVFQKANTGIPERPQFLELSGKVNTRCWVSVVADGRTIFEDNLQPNSSFKWQAKDNLKVTVGNIGALVDLRLNGKPTSIGNGTSNVAERIFYLKDLS